MKHKILIVEDEEMLRTAYELILGSKGYNVAVAKNGQDGLEQLARFKPELVLLDVLMPMLDGRGFLKTADVKKNYPDMKVVVYSNLGDEQTINEMLDLGADRHVLKSSMSPTQLVDLVKKVLA
jgi:DNA-binding NarL/FixJ family response regulator